MPSYAGFIMTLWITFVAMMSALAAGRMGFRGVALVVLVYSIVLGVRILVGLTLSERVASRIATATFWVATLVLLWYLSVFVHDGTAGS